MSYQPLKKRTINELYKLTEEALKKIAEDIIKTINEKVEEIANDGGFSANFILDRNDLKFVIDQNEKISILKIHLPACEKNLDFLGDILADCYDHLNAEISVGEEIDIEINWFLRKELEKEIEKKNLV